MSPWSAQRWAEAATQLLTAALPTRPTVQADWDRLTALVPHAQALIAHADGRGTDTARLQTSITALALKMRDVGELGSARQLVEQIVQVRRRILGAEHPDTLASMNDLAATLSAAGDLDGARQLVEQIVQVRRRILGAEHPDTLASMNDLAALLRDSGQLSGARDLLEQSLKMHRRVHGADHPQTVSSHSTLTEVGRDIDRASLPYVYLAHRGNVLVERLLSKIDKLEHREEDPDRLADLFALDHLATRLRRNQDGLLVLAGRDLPSWPKPVPLTEVARAAIAEIVDYSRVEVRLVDREVDIPAPMVRDLIHLLAELLENATQFSPPGTLVQVEARRIGYAHVVISIADNGLGITDKQTVGLDAHLAKPQPLHALPDMRLGMLVIGRLAAKHNIVVRLRGNPEGGSIAEVTVPLPAPRQTLLPPTPPHQARGSHPVPAPAPDLTPRRPTEHRLNTWQDSPRAHTPIQISHARQLTVGQIRGQAPSRQTITR